MIIEILPKEQGLSPILGTPAGSLAFREMTPYIWLRKPVGFIFGRAEGL